MLANPSTEGVLSLFHDMETVCLALPVSSSEMWIALWRFYTYRRRLERTQRFGSLLLQVCHFVTSLRSHPNFVAFDRPEGKMRRWVRWERHSVEVFAYLMWRVGRLGWHRAH